MLHLGEDMGLPQEKKGLCVGEGSLRLGKGVSQGEPENGFYGVSSPPMRGFTHLGKPLCLSEGRLGLGEPMTALRPVFMAC